MKKINDFDLIAEAYGNIHPTPEQVAVIEVEPTGETVGGCPNCGGDQPDPSEMHMARADLHKAAQYAIKLSEMLENIDALEGWTASKITKAADYLSSVYHWIDYETNGPSTSRYNVGYEEAPFNPAEDSQC